MMGTAAQVQGRLRIRQELSLVVSCSNIPVILFASESDKSSARALIGGFLQQYSCYSVCLFPLGLAIRAFYDLQSSS
ncbi:hypothetical protein BRADI_5g12442v3 [Brachypodium distachyon]|uniref:Uncharacterized protein n=1 Tax=Brachypodium distachyon TaxID=15368 RepID=A0A0Q3GPZ3_BRADI|nr:hypothetical protein BRADI_5g12442v3 [Brachypodium distachyon]